MNIKVYRYSLIWNEIHMIYISELVSSKSKFIAPPPPHTRIYMAASSCLLRRQGDIIKTPKTKKLSLIVFFLIRRWMQGKWTSICLTKAKYNTNRLMYAIIRSLFFFIEFFACSSFHAYSAHIIRWFLWPESNRL